MGTRHLIDVKDVNGELKISQYCQWDGYPTGAGDGIIKFLKKIGNIEKLEQALKKVRFVDEVKDKEFIDSFDKNPNNRTKEQILYFDKYISRDVGYDILQNVCDFKGDELLLSSDSGFEKEGTFCEWYYVVDLQQRKLFIWKKSFDFDKLPTKKALEKMENN